MTAAYDALNLLVAGEWLSPAGRETRAVVNPATGETIGRLPLASDADLDRALAGAGEAFPAWRKVSAVERGRILRRAADLIRGQIDHIALQLTLEEGKPLADSRFEVSAAAEIFEWFAEEGRRAYGRVIPARNADQRQIVLKQPIGPVAAFTPWNFPASTPARKIAGSLAAGCSCIIKPAEETPGTALALARCLVDAGLPAGVLSVVFGDPGHVSARLIASPVIRKISFTGSTAVGKQLARLAADGVKPATLELGGHAPVIVFDDADVDEVAPLAVASKYRNAGQICTSPTRFFVHEAVHDRFVESFVARARGLEVGDGQAAATAMGPCANPRRLAAMEAFIEEARGQGANVALGGQRVGDSGYYWQPTVLTDVPETARIMREEPFGPVAAVTRFGTFDEVVARANAVPFGLAAFAFTRSARRARAIGEALESGMVGVNTFAITVPETPFGGMKESGYGSEGAIEGLDAFLVTKFVIEA